MIETPPSYEELKDVAINSGDSYLRIFWKGVPEEIGAVARLDDFMKGKSSCNVKKFFEDPRNIIRDEGFQKELAEYGEEKFWNELCFLFQANHFGNRLLGLTDFQFSLLPEPEVLYSAKGNKNFRHLSLFVEAVKYYYRRSMAGQKNEIRTYISRTLKKNGDRGFSLN